MLVSDLITRVREALHDTNSALYLAPEVCHTYNRAVEEAQQLLITIGARVCLESNYITGDGTNHTFTLPTGCLGIAPDTLRPRSPATATSNYRHGDEVTLVDGANASFTVAPTSVGMPSAARINATAWPLTISFDCIIASGYIYDYQYFPKIAAVEVGDEGDTSTPWNGFLDRVIQRGMEVMLHAGAEFVGEPRTEWLKEARAAVAQLLGMHVHQRREYVPSTFRGGAWQR